MSGCPQSLTLGRCRTVGDVIAVGDPCYLSDPRFSLRLQNAKAGSWVVTVCHRRFEDVGERVGKLTVTHESATGAAAPWRDSGAVVGVDTGHAAICDAQALIDSDHAPVRSAVVLDHGVLCSTGFGDGSDSSFLWHTFDVAPGRMAVYEADGPGRFRFVGIEAADGFDADETAGHPWNERKGGAS